MTKRILIFLLAALGSIIFLLLLDAGLSSLAWEGGADRPVLVHVETKEGAAIAAARVVCSNAYEFQAGTNYVFSGQTDSAGTVSFWVMFPATGIKFPGFRAQGRYRLTNDVRVEAAGYRPFEAPLAALAVPQRSLYNTQVVVKIRLDRP